MDCKETKKLKAYTLVEVMLYLALLGAMLGVLAGFVTIIGQTKSRVNVAFQVDSEGVQISQLINTELEQLDSISSPSQGNSASSISYTDDTVSKQLNLNSGDLVFQEDVNSYTLNSSNVSISNLTFENLSTESVHNTLRYEFTIEYINTDGRIESNYSKTFYGTKTIR